MSDPRYQAGIVQGCAGSVTIGRSGWPEIPALGPCHGGKPFARCAFCPKPAKNRNPEAEKLPRWSFVRYGDAPNALAVCSVCARRLADAPVEEVQAAIRRIEGGRVA